MGTIRFQRPALSAALPIIPIHCLRHTFVTLALDAEASLRDIQDSAGHAAPHAARRYDRGRYSFDRRDHVAAYVAS